MGVCSETGRPDNDTVDKTRGMKKEKKEITVNPALFIRELTSNFKDNYDIGKKLGGGAFGQVFTCFHKTTQMARAVKVMEKTAIDESELEHFLDEIKILKMMDHPNIVKLYEVYEDRKRYCLVTDLCTGGELFEKLSQGQCMSEKEAAHIMKQLLSAIVYCHSKSIVHRDLKPENLLLESSEADARMKVIDFGTSQIFNPTKKMTMKIGTPYYIAPEVLKQSYTEKCDVWSCGVILYILICGYPPFVGRNDFDIMNRIKKGIIRMVGGRWETASESVKDLVRHMLTLDPSKRYSAQQSLNHAWIKKHCRESFDKEYTMELLNNMRSFKTQHKLQEAALMYITSQLVTNKEKHQLQNVINSKKKVDTNSDGKLSREELLIGFEQLFGHSINVEEEVNRIMRNLDIDNSGFIDYSEFVLATINRKKLLSTEHLILAFQIFDKDSSGTISSDEVKALLGVGDTVPDSLWKDLVKEVDENGDGEISTEEFIAMMSKLLS